MVAVVVVALVGLLTAVPAGAVLGTIDPGYGTAGFAVLPTGSGTDTRPLVDIEVTPSGATWALTQAENSGTGNPTAGPRLLRVDDSGAVVADTVLPLDFQPNYGIGTSLAVDGERVVVLGMQLGSAPMSTRVLRFRADATPDPDFGTGGEVSLAPGGVPGAPAGAGVVPTDVSVHGGRVAVSVIASDGNFSNGNYGYGPGVVGLAADGSLDSSFDDDGFADVPLPASVTGGLSLLFGRIAHDPSGRILVSGVTGVARLDTAGDPDTTFGGAGTGARVMGALPDRTCELVGGGCPITVAANGHVLVNQPGSVYGPNATPRTLTELDADGTTVVGEIDSGWVSDLLATGTSSQPTLTVMASGGSPGPPVYALPLGPGSTGEPAVTVNEFGPGLGAVAGPQRLVLGGNWNDGTTNRSVLVRARLDVPPDTLGPDITIDQPSQQVATGSTFPLTFSCTDPSGLGTYAGEPACIGWVVNGAVSNPVTSTSGLQVIAQVRSGDPLPTAAPGTRSLVVASYDTLGNISYLAATYDVVGAPPPVDVGLAPPTGSTFPAGTSVPVTFTCPQAVSCLAAVVHDEVESPLPPNWQPPTNVPAAPINSGDLLDTSTPGVRTVLVVTFGPSGLVELSRARYEVTAPDTSGPTVSLSPPEGTFEVGEVVPVTFDCQDPSGLFLLTNQPTVTPGPACKVKVYQAPPDRIPVGAAEFFGSGMCTIYPECLAGVEVPSGGLMDTSTAGPRTIVLFAADTRGNITWVTRSYTVVDPGVSGTTTDGGSLTTGGSPSGVDPLTTSVVTPVGGAVRIVERDTQTTPPVGYALFGQEVSLTAPNQTTASPLVLTFQLDGSLLGGTAASAVQVWRNGALVPNCVGGSAATQANPDPCVKQRASITGGGARVTVLSSQASVWGFGRMTAVAPGAPGGVSATAGIRSVTASWAPPAADGGAPISAYQVTATPVSVPAGVTAVARTVTVSGSPPATSATVGSLVNGVSYEVTVRARNAVNTAYGPYSSPSASVTTATAPAAPVITGASGGLRRVTATWDAPADGGSPVTSYRLTATPVGGGTARAVTVSAPATTGTVTSLADNTAYTLTVTATNAAGTSTVSAPAGPVSTRSGVPSAPTGVATTPGVRSAVVTWSPPADDGGAPISGYRVTATPVAATVPAGMSAVARTVTVSGSPPVTTATVGSLLNGVTYTVTVTARNSGVTTYSAASDPVDVRVKALPGAPVITDVTPGPTAATVTWTPPDSDAPITQYTVRATAPRPGTTNHTVTRTVTGAPPATTLAVTGLLTGLDYTVTVSATSAVGTGPASTPSEPVRPQLGMSVTDRSANEGNTGTTSFAFTVRLSAAQEGPVTVDVTTGEGTAGGLDFTSLATTLTFTPGQTSKTVTIRVNGDTLPEPDETFTVNLSNPSLGGITKASGTGTIVNDDTAAPAPAELAAYGYHACALRSGAVWCWGSDYGGYLGIGAPTTVAEPAPVPGITDAVALASGVVRCVTRTDGTVWCWGYNGSGAVGDGTTVDRSSPVQVSGLAGATAVAVGASHACAVHSAGRISCWGSNHYGQLGNGTTTSSPAPTEVPGITNAVSITSSEFTTCALLADRTARCWGWNDYGQTGDGAPTTVRSTPATPPLTGIVAVAPADGHTCAALTDGTVRCWGLNSHGQLGDGTTENRLSPVTVTGITTATGVAAGDYHSCALLADGTVRCWGSNYRGQLGDGTLANSTLPVTVSALTTVSAIEGTDEGMCAQREDRTIWCWGARLLPTGGIATDAAPAPVSGLP